MPGRHAAFVPHMCPSDFTLIHVRRKIHRHVEQFVS